MSTMVVGLRILVFNGVWVAKQSKKRVKNHRISFILIWVELRPMFMCNFLIIKKYATSLIKFIRHCYT